VHKEFTVNIHDTYYVFTLMDVLALLLILAVALLIVRVLRRRIKAGISRQ